MSPRRPLFAGPAFPYRSGDEGADDRAGVMDLAIPKTIDSEASEIGVAAPRHIEGISDWLITQGLEGAGFESILSGFADRLNALGLQVQRGMIVMRTLHPSVDALNYVWRRDGVSNR